MKILKYKYTLKIIEKLIQEKLTNIPTYMCVYLYVYFCKISNGVFLTPGCLSDVWQNLIIEPYSKVRKSTNYDDFN